MKILPVMSRRILHYGRKSAKSYFFVSLAVGE